MDKGFVFYQVGTAVMYINCTNFSLQRFKVIKSELYFNGYLKPYIIYPILQKDIFVFFEVDKFVHQLIFDTSYNSFSQIYPTHIDWETQMS
jgi:hypothetical protein